MRADTRSRPRISSTTRRRCTPSSSWPRRKPKGNEFGDPENPTPVVSSAGVLKGTTDATLVAPFNNLPAIERLFAAHPGEIAAIIIEPIMMNIAFCMPDEGYIHGLLEIAHKHGALLI